MKIAISAQTNNNLESTIAQHFGRCPFFAMVELEDKAIKNIELIENPFFASHEVGEVPNFIRELKADVMISGGMGGRAIQFFKDFGIGVYTGANGSVKETIEKYVQGQLNEANPCSESVDHGHGESH